MSKISELSDGGALQSTDYLIAVRSGGNVKVQLSELPAGIDTGGNIEFGDNEKAIFGAGSDLQIYHDGSNSYIKDAGTGNLLIQANQLRIQSDTGENFIECVPNAQVVLRYDNNVALQTTSTGIDVTGTAVTDGLTVAGNVSIDGGTIKLDGNYPVGTSNVALGNRALDDASLTGGYNVAIGTDALTANTTASVNTAVGSEALKENTTGAQNTAIGGSALFSNTTGDYNTAVGRSALNQNTTASANTAVGRFALSATTTASNNTAVGYQAGYSNTTGTGLVATGYQALYSNTTGNNNVAYGESAMYANSTGAANSAMGRSALQNNTTGSNNAALGFGALNANTTASNNTAVGYFAGNANTTGVNNTILGSGALDTNTTGSQNTAIGTFSLEVATGNNNTGVGYGAGYLITTGSKNTILGCYNGNQDGLDIRTVSNNIVLSDGDGNVYAAFIEGRNSWAFAAENSGTGRLEARADVNVADDATLTLTDAECGAVIIHVYDNGTGKGAIFFATYSGATEILAQSGDFANSDSDGNFCVYKSTSSHTVTFKNRIGASRNMSFMIVGAQAAKT